MDIVIVSEKKSIITEQEDAELLSVSFLFANDIHFATNGSTFLTLHNHFDEFKDYQKRELIKNILPKYDTTITKERVDELFYSIRELRKKRGKIIEEIRLLKKTEDLYRSLEGVLLNYCKDYLTHFGIINILPFARQNDTSIIKLWTLNTYNADSGIPDFFLHCVASNLYHESEFPFFPERLEQYARRISAMDTKRYHSQDGNIPVFLSEPMFVLPVPKKLESNQMLMLRNDILLVIQSWHEFVVQKAIELTTIPFAGESFPLLHQILFEIQQVCSSVQSCVDNHPYVELLRNNDEALKMVRVHIGVTSMENIISMYGSLQVITSEEILYVRDEVGQNVNLQSCGLFLYLQSYE